MEVDLVTFATLHLTEHVSPIAKIDGQMLSMNTDILTQSWVLISV